MKDQPRVEKLSVSLYPEHKLALVRFARASNRSLSNAIQTIIAERLLPAPAPTQPAPAAEAAP